MTEAGAFRAQFPVFERASYLNAGTEGPVPAVAVDAARQRLEFEARNGRSGKEFFEQLMEMAQSLRSGYAEVLGCGPQHVALTGSTTDGVNTVLAGLDLQPGDEVLTSDEEHPGLLAPLGQARRRQGIRVRVVPFARLADEVTTDTRLVACSHVSWVSGRVIDMQALNESGVSVLLDAAQAIGAIPVDIDRLGCDFYAASGQKWLCGPEGSGCLFVREEKLDECSIPWPSYGSLADPQRPLEVEPAEGAARFDHGFPSGLRSAWALASLEVLRAAGWDWVQSRAAALAESLAASLRQRGAEVLPRGHSTLVSWRVSDGRDPAEEVERLAAAGFVVRSIPQFGGLIRASVGAWSSPEELEALAAAAGPA
ncbi:MAG TPA: aminotransferase class V-fold PLP-dependent enzyme [Solirubrobacteraceae bacterium]